MTDDPAETDRPWQVTYYETVLHLTNVEYTALTILSIDDPVEAMRMADRLYLAQEGRNR